MTKQENTSKHRLKMVTVANGAGRGVCICGWKSKVSDDALMFTDDYYSLDDIRDDYKKHLREYGTIFPT